jgi:serine/threonine protein kinase
MNLIGQRIGQYEILARFGEGGMATVYRARQDKVGREVAIKVMSPALARRDVFAQRFEREAQLIARLSHPHIVKLFDYGVLRGFHLRLIDPSFDPKTDLYYFVMELMLGGSLAERLRKARLTPPEVSAILHQIAPALDYAHQQGIVHRDLKPANVLFDAHQNAFLTDFGIAKLLDENGNQNALTQEGTTLGTPSYMSPELWQGENIGGWTDIYALGVMLFEMLCGKVPFTAGTPYRVMHMHLYDQPPALQRYDQTLPDSLNAVVRRALAKAPADRFPTAVALAEAFDEALRAAPVRMSASPAESSAEMAETSSTTPEVMSSARQRWLLISLAVVLALGVIAALALLSGRL